MSECSPPANRIRAWQNFFLCAAIYAIVGLFFFDSLSKPIAFLTLWSGKLGLPWRVWVGGSAVVATLVCLIPSKNLILRWRPPLVFLIWVLGSILVTAQYADRLRERRLAAFKADASFQHSFLWSLREAPEELQLDLHAGALKDCAPYGWSYSELGC